MPEIYFTDGDLRHYVNALLELEEETDEFYFTIGERNVFQDIVTEALEDWIQKRKQEDKDED